MRALWFTGVQLPAVTGETLTRAGWQEGLRCALERFSPEIELGIASFGSKEYAPIHTGNATYFNILRKYPDRKWARIRTAWKHEGFNADELTRCMEIVEKFNPDIIHFHGSENPFGLIADRIAVPTVLSLQAVVNGYFPFLFTDLPWQKIIQLILSKDFLLGRGLLHKYLDWKNYTQVEKKIFCACFNYIGRTNWDRALTLGLNPRARYFHSDEVLADEFYTLEWKPETSCPNVIYSTSSNAFFKGSVLLIEAFNILNRMNRATIHLRMAGVDEQSEAGKIILEKVKGYGLENQVHLLGRLNPKQIVNELLHCGAFVLPSHIDNSPNSLCEAMLMGVPCVASYVGGIPSLIEDGKSGLMYHDRDPYALAKRLTELMDNPTQAAQIGSTARRTALKRHNPRIIAQQISAIYSKLS